jgi:hypothetical protein
MERIVEYRQFILDFSLSFFKLRVATGSKLIFKKIPCQNSEEKLENFIHYCKKITKK